MSRSEFSEAESLISELRSRLGGAVARCFLHNDLHEMNIICTAEDRLLAIIDWGDAGWGDPVLDFAKLPMPAMGYVLDAYDRGSPPLMGEDAYARMIWDKICAILEDRADDPRVRLPTGEMRRFLDSGGKHHADT